MNKSLFRHVLIVMLCLLSSASLHAQSLSVDSFYLDKEQNALFPGIRKNDRDGNAYALVRIVTSERGFKFFGDMALGLGGQVERDGEYWVYVPRETVHFTIHHDVYGRIENYEFPLLIESGKTYRLILGIQGGRHVSITSAGAAKAKVWVDGELIGETPIVGRFLHNGRRHIHAEQGKFEADTLFTISDGRGRLNLNLDMKDMSHHYGQADITVTNDAEIWFRGEQIGHGTAHIDVREGPYTLTTRRVDCDSATTSFVIMAGQRIAVQANPPTPHTGYLHIVRHTKNVEVVESNGRNYDWSAPAIVPVGTYHFTFSRKGYDTQSRTIVVHRGDTIKEDITLPRTSYIGDIAFYAGAGFTVRSLMGITGTLGFVFQNIDLQLAYTMGISSSKNLYWYDQAGLLQSGLRYKMNSWNIRLGYQFKAVTHFGFTPQLGFQYQQLSGKLLEGTTKYGDGAKAMAATLGLKAFYVPTKYLALFLQPEYALVMKRDDTYKTAASKADFSQGGFSATIGLLFNYPIKNKKK